MMSASPYTIEVVEMQVNDVIIGRWHGSVKADRNTNHSYEGKEQKVVCDS